MSVAYFRFYADLNELLPDQKRQQSFPHPAYDGTQTVKHLVEALGIPHTEVDLILVDGTPVGFEHQVQSGEYISIYPAFTSLDTSTVKRLRPELTLPVKLLLDNHLGRLARYLRLLGFDTLYFNDQLNDEQLAELSYNERRVLLSRDRGLLKRKQVVHGYCLRTKDPRQQLKSVIVRFKLADLIQPWSRCLRCNGNLRNVPKKTVMDRLEPKTKLYFDEFHQCASCKQVYWQGSHYTKLQTFLKQILDEFPQNT